MAQGMPYTMDTFHAGSIRMPGSCAASAMYDGVNSASGEENLPARGGSGSPGRGAVRFAPVTTWKGKYPVLTWSKSLSESVTSNFSPLTRSARTQLNAVVMATIAGSAWVNLQLAETISATFRGSLA